MNNRNTVERSSKSEMKKIVAAVEVVKGGERMAFWTQIGVAFVNSDSSLNLRLDFYPTNVRTTTIQVRDFDAHEGEES